MNTSKESPRTKRGVLGTFLDVAKRLFERKSTKPKKTNEEINNQAIKVVMIENRTLTMSHSEIVRDEEIIIVKGTVAKKPGRLIPMGTHLHVVAINKKGKPMLNDVVRCELSQLKRKDIKSIRYMAQFPTPLEAIDLVKIIYHDHNHSQCSQWGCRKRT